MGAREDIAAAASGVDGVECSEFYSGATKPGSAWVERARTTYDPGLHPSYGAKPFWRVRVVMPQDIPKAERWIEDNQDTLVAALHEAMAVTTATPETLTLADNQSMKVLTIDGHT